MSRISCRNVAVVIFLACIGSRQAVAYSDDKQPAPRIAPHVNRLIQWLPQDTEAVIVSQERFTIQLDDEMHCAFQRLPTNVCAALGLSRGDLWNNLLGRATIVVAVSGCRGFSDSTGGRQKICNGCDILQFDAEFEDSVQNGFKACIKVADSVDEVAGQNVGVFTIKSKMPFANNELTLFLANPQPTILICATDRSYLKRVLTRMDGKGAGRALPDSLPEWQHVDLKAPVWAVRHYRKEIAQNDPTSPLGAESKVNLPDPQAVGFVFWYDDNPKSANAMTIRYLSKAPDAMEIVAKGWNSGQEGLNLKISQVAPDVVEAALARDEGDAWRPFLSRLHTYCGKASVRD